MAALLSRGHRRRRAMNEINMVPFIDVMLVLLIIFMVTAPLITTGVVDLPSVGKSQQRPQGVIEVLIGADDKLRLRLDGGEPAPLTLAQLGTQVRAKQAGNADMPVVISADKNIKYDSVMSVMAALQKERVRRVGLSVKQGN